MTTKSIDLVQRALGLLRLWRYFDRYESGQKRVRTVKGHCHKKSRYSYKFSMDFFVVYRMTNGPVTGWVLSGPTTHENKSKTRKEFLLTMIAKTPL